MPIKAIKTFVEGIPAALKEKHGVYSFEFVVAERGGFLAKKRLTYSARFRVDDERKEVRFTEALRESGAGLSSGDDAGPGFGFKKESYKTVSGSREGSIEEQSRLFGKEYRYTFDVAKVRAFVGNEAARAGYAFSYQITARGL